jgi:hypothetical protein
VLDSTIARIEAIPEPMGAHARQRAWTLAYAAYVITDEPRYIDVVRRWSGREPPPVMLALAALAAHDTARAVALAARFPTADSTRLITPPDQIDDPLSRAAVLAAIGQKRAAVATLEAVDPSRFQILESDPHWAMYPRTLLERGALHEQLGEKAKAAVAYERYLDLMRDADATLQPQIQLATARLRALRDAPASTLAPRARR